jgi:hypothetical protein
MSAASQHSPSLSRGTPLWAMRCRRGVNLVMAGLGAAVLAACAAPTAPPQPAPPPPKPSSVVVVETVPYRPLPPGGAYYVMDIPERGQDGRRITVNAGLNDDQLVWNLRSAWNVAALNCLAPEYAPILEGYRTFLTRAARPLKAVNDRIEKDFNTRYRVRRDAMVARDGYTTRVYNFFASPPARAGFCRAALDLSNRALAAPPTDPLAFARANFDGLLLPFDEFFSEYEAYQQASAEWDAKWGAEYGPSQPGWVALQEARLNGIRVPDLTARAVIDPETGVAVPVIPVTEGFVSQPVVEPITATPERQPGQ